MTTFLLLYNLNTALLKHNLFFEIIKNKYFFMQYSQTKKKNPFPYRETTILVLGQTVELYGTLMVQSTILMGHTVSRISMVTKQV
jgi:hypothetical protein